MNSRTLVTGFGPFGTVVKNPSACLAEACGAPHEVLAVSFDAVDRWIASFNSVAIDALLLMGVASGRSQVSLETTARNQIGSVPDVLGVDRRSAEIDAALPATLAGTLWSAQLLGQASGDLVVSHDAGTYLCNFIYFRALQSWPHLRIGFLHVADFDAVSFARQSVILADLLQAI